MVKNPPEDSPRIVARLAYDNPEAAVEFLAKAFGFIELKGARISNHQGILITDLKVLDSQIMIGRSGSHGLMSPASLGGYTQALIVYVDDIDRHFTRARDAGAKIVSEPADQFWGDRRYEATDVEGHYWSFHEHLRDVSAEEMEKAMEDIGAG